MVLTVRGNKPVKMDDVDFKLLELLIRDGRITFKELAKKAGIDERMASRRVERMEKDGVIMGFTANIDWSKLGMNTQIWVGTRTSVGIETRNALFDFLKKNPFVVHVESTVGSYEYVLHIICKDLQEFRAYIGSEIEPLTAGLSSSIVTSPVKEYDIVPLLHTVKNRTLKTSAPTKGK